MTRLQKRICVIVPVVVFGGRLAFTIPDIGFWHAIIWFIDDFWTLVVFSLFCIATIYSDS